MPKRNLFSETEKHEHRSRTFYICPSCLGESDVLNLELHHINSCAYDDNESNLISICGFCHDLAHHGKIKSSELKDKKKEFEDKNIFEVATIYKRFVVNHSAHWLHDKYAAKHSGRWGHLKQAIRMVEYGLNNLPLNEYQKSEALLKLIHLERLYGGKYMIRAEYHLGGMMKRARSNSSLLEEILYQKGYIKYLKNDLCNGLKYLINSSSITNNKIKKAHIEIVQYGITQNVTRESLDEKEYIEYAERLKDLDAVLYQNAFQHLIKKKIIDENLDEALKMIEVFESINKDIPHEKTSVPNYYRGRINLLEKKYPEAEILLRMALKERIKTNAIEGISENRAFLGEALEEMAEESGDSSFENEAEILYEQGIKEGSLMANNRGFQLCQHKLEKLNDKRFIRRKGKN